ncbi:hypothetical protein Y032_0082g1567 [Ancylostoma ceylanicum]|uniref:Saposin B-type domain-containing protein n=1 Tax=Ancylostoma ceylanicum TaxID=53326 RepID=A0A016TRY9_9BILA|nr:hypothetical protein Y032_0082g1567 [Ancylostoma ceylanicum]
MSVSVRSLLVFLFLATISVSPFFVRTNGDVQRKAANSSREAEESLGCRLCRKIALDEITIVADRLVSDNDFVIITVLLTGITLQKVGETFIVNICNQAFGLVGAAQFQLIACNMFVKGNLDKFIHAFSDPKQEQLEVTAVCKFLHLCTA